MCDYINKNDRYVLELKKIVLPLHSLSGTMIAVRVIEL